jgi:hypothetical protein
MSQFFKHVKTRHAGLDKPAPARRKPGASSPILDVASQLNRTRACALQGIYGNDSTGIYNCRINSLP